MKLRLSRTLTLLPLIPLALLATSVHAQIYKCVGKDGRVSFQDSKCIGAPGKEVDVRPANSGVVVMTPKTVPRVTKSTGDVEDLQSGAPARTQTQQQRDAAQLKAMEMERRRRAIDHEINEAVTAVESLKLSMEQDLAGLRARNETMTSSVPGSILAVGAANDLQAATNRYEDQIRSAQERVADLRKSRDALNDAARTERDAARTERRSDAASPAKP